MGQEESITAPPAALGRTKAEDADLGGGESKCNYQDGLWTPISCFTCS